VHVTTALRAASGLNARYSYISNGRETNREQVDAAVTSSSILRRIHTALTPSTDQWDGYLLIPSSDSYRFIVNADGAAQLTIDGALVADKRMRTGGPSVLLRSGLHAIRLKYMASSRSPRLSMFQSREVAGVFEPVPSLYFVPRGITFKEAWTRRTAVIAGRVLPLVALFWTVLVAIVAVRRTRPPATRRSGTSHRIYAVLGGAAVMFAVGVWWGLPAYVSWEPDELLPGDIRDAWGVRFSSGWATKYPPVHFGLLGAVSFPYYAAAQLGLIDSGDLLVASCLLVISRLTSVAMALGIVWLTYAITEEFYGRRAALFAALVLISAMPLTYYSKTANLDVPYLFWVTLALRYYVRTASRAGPCDFYRFAVAGAIAICTKDQAYGFFVLPALLLAGMALAHEGASNVPTKRVLIRMCGLTALALMILMNVPFNISGVVRHFQLITGPASQDFQMYARTPAGTAKMLVDSVRLMGNIMSWPLFVAAVAGAGIAVKCRQVPIILLLIAGLSYSITFLWIVLYQYDRFLLGLVITMSPAAGWWLDNFTRRGCSYRTIRLVVGLIVFAYAIGRCAALDMLMLRDSRYVAERGLRSESRPGDTVGGVGLRSYLTRPEVVPWSPIRATPEQLVQLAPDLLVVNVGYALRTGEGNIDTLAPEMLRNEPTYSLVGEYRAKARFPLSLEPRFQRMEQDPFSNLTKINPLIRIYKRRKTTR